MRRYVIKGIILTAYFMQFSMYASQNKVNESKLASVDHKKVYMLNARISAVIGLYNNIKHNATTPEAQQRLLQNLLYGSIPEYNLLQMVLPKALSKKESD